LEKLEAAHLSIVMLNGEKGLLATASAKGLRNENLRVRNPKALARIEHAENGYAR